MEEEEEERKEETGKTTVGSSSSENNNCNRLSQETEVEYDGGCDQDTKENGVSVFTVWSWSAVCDLSMNIFVCLSAFNNTGQFLSRPV